MLPCDVKEPNSCPVLVAHDAYFCGRQLRSTASALGGHVHVVLGRRSQKEMVRVYTCPVVAFVANVKAGRVQPLKQNHGCPVCSGIAPDSVPVAVVRSGPQPAPGVGALRHERHERGYVFGLHASLIPVPSDTVSWAA